VTGDRGDRRPRWRVPEVSGPGGESRRDSSLQRTSRRVADRPTGPRSPEGSHRAQQQPAARTTAGGRPAAGRPGGGADGPRIRGRRDGCSRNDEAPQTRAGVWGASMKKPAASYSPRPLRAKYHRR
jgi:hypothetical protein